MTAPLTIEQRATRAGARWPPPPMLRAVIALGITQIVAWGTSVYALGTLAGPISADTGWSRSLVFAGLTVGLLASGVVSTATGRATDRHGARVVMAVGSALLALGLAVVALAPHPIVYLAGWALIGPAMRMCLYDAAFTGLVQIMPTRGRRAISYLTLFGGLASTVFWPIGHVLAGEIGWRGTLLVYALINLLVCAPLNAWGLARAEPPDPTQATTSATGAAATGTAAPPLVGDARWLALALFAAATSATAFVFGAMAVHLPAVLAASGLTAAAAVTLASLKGVAQVAGRICEIVWGHRLSPIGLGRLSIALMPMSFALLMAGGASFAVALAFTLTFGVANGLVTIVRGAVPLALFGREGYGTVLGLLATPYLIVNAVAPAILAIVIDVWGMVAAEAVVLGAGLVATLAMEILAAWYRRQAHAQASASAGA